MVEEKIICIGCPMGCETTLNIDDQGKVIKIVGYQCKEGRQFVIEEYQSPVRVFTATILTENSSRPLLPVKTNRPIIKTKLKEVAKALIKVRAIPPIQVGQIVLQNFLNTGADIIATDDLLN
jgi:CxxC motif-containing protein